MTRAAAVLPRLHIVTDDAVLAEPNFAETAAALLAAGGPRVALHLRGHATAAVTLFAHAVRLRDPAADAGALLVVNDRIDVAMAARARAVQLGRRSIPAAAARRMLPHAWIGMSVHEHDDIAALAEGTDLLLAGTIYESASHPGSPTTGPAFVSTVAAFGRPVVAIGGVRAERVGELAAAGAHGVAVLAGIWRGARPLDALHTFMAALAAAYGTDA